MEQIIYADVLFIVNFSMDFLALYITSKILHHDCHFLPMTLSAGLGALYGVVSLIMSGIISVVVTAGLYLNFVKYGTKDSYSGYFQLFLYFL